MVQHLLIVWGKEKEQLIVDSSKFEMRCLERALVRASKVRGSSAEVTAVSLHGDVSIASGRLGSKNLGSQGYVVDKVLKALDLLGEILHSPFKKGIFVDGENIALGYRERGTCHSVHFIHKKRAQRVVFLSQKRNPYTCSSPVP